MQRTRSLCRLMPGSYIITVDVSRSAGTIPRCTCRWLVRSWTTDSCYVKFGIQGVTALYPTARTNEAHYIGARHELCLLYLFLRFKDDHFIFHTVHTPLYTRTVKFWYCRKWCTALNIADALAVFLMDAAGHWTTVSVKLRQQTWLAGLCTLYYRTTRHL